MGRTLGRLELATLFDEVSENDRGEIKIRIKNAAEARRLIAHVLEDSARHVRSSARLPVREFGAAESERPLVARSISGSADQDDMELSELFDSCATPIESKGRELGHRDGWRFLTGPRRTLCPSTELAFISLNPGGGAESAHQSGASYEEGSSYVTESWLNDLPGEAPLQRQGQALFREIMNHSLAEGGVADFLSHRVLTGHFIPFRSRSFAVLPNPAKSVAFGRRLWMQVLKEWRPRLILTIDHETYSNLGSIISELFGREVDHRHFVTGWGSNRCEGTRFADFRADGVITLARLPHLSRFKLFSEPGYSSQREAALKPFFEWVTER